MPDYPSHIFSISFVVLNSLLFCVISTVQWSGATSICDGIISLWLCCFCVALLFPWGFVVLLWIRCFTLWLRCFAFAVSLWLCCFLLRLGCFTGWGITTQKCSFLSVSEFHSAVLGDQLPSKPGFEYGGKERIYNRASCFVVFVDGRSVERLQNNWAWPRVLIDGSQRTPYIDGSYTHTITHSVLRV